MTKFMEMESNNGKIGLINVAKTAVMIATCFMILAVDFPIADRRFAKTNEGGYSLMDTGTIWVVLISSATRNIKKHYLPFPVLARIKRGLIVSSAALFLGWFRFFFLLWVGYPSHVDEYGVHWNFFMTLGCIELVFSVLCVYKLSFYLMGGFLVVYEIVLEFGGFKEWILSPERDMTSFFSMNREGILSIPLFTFIMLIGPIFMNNYKSIAENARKQGKFLTGQLKIFMISVVGVLASLTFVTYAESFPNWNAYRKLSNIPFLMFGVLGCFFTCGGTLIGILMFKRRYYSLVSEGISDNKLLFFI
jgi:phosphatidylinositol glycan class W